MVKSFRGNYSNQMLDQGVVGMLKRRIDLHHRTQMLLGRMESSRDQGPCMDAEVDPLRSVARRLRLREGCSMGRAIR
jgi:hypothetical protein